MTRILGFTMCAALLMTTYAWAAMGKEAHPLKADPKSAEAHYDLALTLDKAGDHGGATKHFQKARDLGKDNAEIHDSEILKKHLKM